jgi:uncharacterized protein involved in exopolysaccharide biosynthesis
MNEKKIEFKQSSKKVDTETNDSISIFTKLDLRIYLARFLKKRNLFMLILLPVIFFTIAAVTAKTLIKDSWTAQCILFRHTKGANVQKDMSPIYKPIDIDTLIETIRTRKNIINVIKQLNLDMGINTFYSITKISKHKNNSIITISAEYKNSRTAADIANTLANVFLKSYIDLQNASSRGIHNYFQTSSSKIRSKIDDYERQLQDYLKTHKVISIEGETTAKFEQLNEMELKLLESKMLKTTLKIRLSDITGEVKNMKKEIPLSYVVSTSSEKEIDMLNKQLAILSQKYTKENPKVIRLIAEIKKLKAEKSKKGKSTPAPEKIIYGENIQRQTLVTEKSNVESQLNSVDKNIDDINAGIKLIKEKLGNLSKLESTYSRLKRKIALNQELLKKVEHILASSVIITKADVSDIEILEKAVPPSFPQSSSRKVLALVGGILGFLAALIFIILPEYLDFSVKSGRFIEDVLKVKLLGLLPDKDAVDESIFYSAQQIIIEGILSSSDINSKPVSVFCSSIADAGKSFAIGFITEMLKEKNLKTLYIDSVYDVTDDIEDCVINNYLYKSSKSDSNLKVNKISDYLDKVYFHVNSATYKFPLDKSRLQEFLESQKVNYDYIIFELFEFNKNRQLFSAFTSAADFTVLVSRFKRSNKFADKALVDFIKSRNTKNLSGLVNHIDKQYYKYLM